MKGYVQGRLHKFQHIQPTQKKHAPHGWQLPNYGVAEAECVGLLYNSK